MQGLPRRDRKYKFEVKGADLAGNAAALRQTEATSSNVAKPSTRGTHMSSSNSNKLVTKALGGQAPTAKPNDHTENAAAHTSAGQCCILEGRLAFMCHVAGGPSSASLFPREGYCYRCQMARCCS